MSKLKIGDKVVIIATDYVFNEPEQYLQVGDTGVLADVWEGGYDVRMDKGEPTDSMGVGWAFYEDEVALVEEA